MRPIPAKRKMEPRMLLRKHKNQLSYLRRTAQGGTRTRNPLLHRQLLYRRSPLQRLGSKPLARMGCEKRYAPAPKAEVAPRVASPNLAL